MISKSIQCDICGQEIPCYNNIAITENSAMMQIWGVGMKRTCVPQRIDLCRDCYERFINWLERCGNE
jgi:hypothetical protein